MLKLWLLYNILLASAIFGTSITSAKSLTQFLLPLLLLPLLYYLARQWHHKPKRKITEEFSSAIPTLITDSPNLTSVKAEEGVPISDDNRRLFLKLIGTSSLSVLFMVLLGKKEAHAAFFGSVPGPGTVSVKNIAGDPIDPAEKQPTDGYTISEVDDTTTPYYYGFVHQTGAWYITKEDASGSYRYTKGSSSFATNWTSRVGLSYDYFDNVF